MHANSHAAFKFFEAGSTTIKSTDNRVCPQRIPYVLIYAPVDRGSAGYLRQNVKCLIDVVLQTLRAADHLLTSLQQYGRNELSHILQSGRVARGKWRDLKKYLLLLRGKSKSGTQVYMIPKKFINSTVG